MTLKTALFYERYELKYHIPFSLIDEIEKHIAPYCEMDHFSKKSESNFYTINNLYLDTPNFLFFKRKLHGEDDRFNMRIRTYGDEISKLYFLEVKNKSQGFVRKTRAQVKDLTIFDRLENDKPIKEKREFIQNDFFHDFAHKVYAYGARPIVFTQYKRKAYFSTIDEYARITFDIDLKCIERRNYTFERSPGMKNYDHSQYYKDHTNVILELKCENKIPFWILDIVKKFNLTRTGFSKFCFSVNEVMQFKHQITDPLNRISLV